MTLTRVSDAPPTDAADRAPSDRAPSDSAPSDSAPSDSAPVFGSCDGPSGPRGIECALAIEGGEVDVELLQRSSRTECTPGQVAAAAHRALNLALAARSLEPGDMRSGGVSSGHGARRVSRSLRAAAQHQLWVLAPALVLVLWAATEWHGRGGAEKPHVGEAPDGARAGSAAAELQAVRLSAQPPLAVPPSEVRLDPAAPVPPSEPRPPSLAARARGEELPPAAYAPVSRAPATPAPPRGTRVLPARPGTRARLNGDVAAPASPSASQPVPGPEPAAPQLPRVRILEDERPRTRVIE